VEKGQSGWQASLGWGCSGWVGHVVRLHRGLCLNEEHIQWKTNLWSLDPESEAKLFLQNVGRYPSTQNHIPEVLILQLQCSEDLELYSYSDCFEGKSTKHDLNEGCLESKFFATVRHTNNVALM